MTSIPCDTLSFPFPLWRTPCPIISGLDHPSSAAKAGARPGPTCPVLLSATESSGDPRSSSSRLERFGYPPPCMAALHKAMFDCCPRSVGQSASLQVFKSLLQRLQHLHCIHRRPPGAFALRCACCTCTGVVIAPPPPCTCNLCTLCTLQVCTLHSAVCTLHRPSAHPPTHNSHAALHCTPFPSHYHHGTDTDTQYPIPNNNTNTNTTTTLAPSHLRKLAGSRSPLAEKRIYRLWSAAQPLLASKLLPLPPSSCYPRVALPPPFVRHGSVLINSISIPLILHSCATLLSLLFGVTGCPSLVYTIVVQDR